MATGHLKDHAELTDDWVDDDNTLRAYESADDAYRVFRKMLDGGNPPDDWNSLLKAARSMADDLAPI